MLRRDGQGRLGMSSDCDLYEEDWDATPASALKDESTATWIVDILDGGNLLLRRLPLEVARARVTVYAFHGTS